MLEFQAGSISDPDTEAQCLELLARISPPGEKCGLAGPILLLNKVVLLPDGRAAEALVNFLFLLG